MAQKKTMSLRPKAGHRSTLRPCVRRFWHRASDYVRLCPSCQVVAASLFRQLCLTASSRTMLTFENNVSCSSRDCSTLAFCRR